MAKAEMLDVPAADVAELKKCLRCSTTRKSLADRARIILLSTQGLSAAAIEEKIGVARITVYKWRERYSEEGLGALGDRPRPGQPRKLDPRDAKRILTMTTTTIPKESTHWSLRLMAKYSGVTVHQVSQVWKAADLRGRSNGERMTTRGTAPRAFKQPLTSRPERSSAASPSGIAPRNSLRFSSRSSARFRNTSRSTSSSRAAARTRRPRSRCTSRVTPASSFTLRRRARRGSTPWNAGFPRSSAVRFTAAPSRAWRNFASRFEGTSRRTMPKP
jgi:transposase